MEAESTHYVECGLPKSSFKWNGDNRIVGGWEANPHSIPWQVRLYVYYDALTPRYCGGSLVRLQPGNQTRFVLTAAHCVTVYKNNRYYNTRPRNIEVLLGAHFTFPDLEWKVIPVKKYTRRRYDHKTMEDDIALLYLRSPVTFTDRIMAVCLPESDEPLPKNASCYVSGWGYIDSRYSSTFTLQVVDVNILENKDCGTDKKTWAKSFCAGHIGGGKDACQGDSGGPLMCFVNGSFILYGITSNGIGCGQPERPGVYSEVAKHIDWIKRRANQAEPLH